MTLTSVLFPCIKNSFVHQRLWSKQKWYESCDIHLSCWGHVSELISCNHRDHIAICRRPKTMGVPLVSYEKGMISGNAVLPWFRIISQAFWKIIATLRFWCNRHRSAFVPMFSTKQPVLLFESLSKMPIWFWVSRDRNRLKGCPRVLLVCSFLMWSRGSQRTWISWKIA